MKKSAYELAKEKQQENERIKAMQKTLVGDRNTIPGSGYEKAVQHYMNIDPRTDRLARIVTNNLADAYNKNQQKKQEEERRRQQEALEKLREQNKALMTSQIMDTTGLSDIMQRSTGLTVKPMQTVTTTNGIKGNEKALNPNFETDFKNAYNNYLQKVQADNNARMTSQIMNNTGLSDVMQNSMGVIVRPKKTTTGIKGNEKVLNPNFETDLEKAFSNYIQKTQANNKPLMTNQIINNTGLGEVMQNKTGITVPRSYEPVSGPLNKNFSNDLQDAYDKYLEDIRKREEAAKLQQYQAPTTYYQGEYDGKSDIYSADQRNAALMADESAQQKLNARNAAIGMTTGINSLLAAQANKPGKQEVFENITNSAAAAPVKETQQTGGIKGNEKVLNPNFLSDAKIKAEQYIANMTEDQLKKHYAQMLAEMSKTYQHKTESGQYEQWTTEKERERVGVYIKNREDGLFDNESDPNNWSTAKLTGEADALDTNTLTDKGRDAKKVIRRYFNGQATDEDLNALVYSLWFDKPMDGNYSDYKMSGDRSRDGVISQYANLIKDSNGVTEALIKLSENGVTGLGNVDAKNRYQDILDDRQYVELTTEEMMGSDVSPDYNPEVLEGKGTWIAEKFMGETYLTPKFNDDLALSYYYALNPDAIEKSTNKIATPEEQEEYFWTPEQRETFIKLMNAGRREEARAYREGLHSSALAARTRYLEAKAKTAASGENGWWTTFGQAFVAPATGIMGTIGAIGNVLGIDGFDDPNHPIYSMQHEANAVHDVRGDLAGLGLQGLYEQLTGNADDETAYKIGRTLYGVGTSVMDNLVAMGVSLPFGGPTSKLGMAIVQLVMSTEATSQSMLQNLESNKSPLEAGLMAIGNGIVEAVTEKFSLDALLRNPGKISKYLLQNAFIEGTEEVAADVLNMALDEFVSSVFGHDSDFEKEIRALEKSGDKEALKTAWLNKLEEVGTSFASGMLSGFALSGGFAAASGVQNAVNDRQTAEGLNSKDRLNRLLAAAEKVQGDEKFNAAIEKARAIVDEKGELSKKDALSLVRTLRKSGNNVMSMTARSTMTDVIEEEIRAKKRDAATDEDIRKAAEAAAEMVTTNGTPHLTKEQRDAYKAVPEAKRVVDQLTGPAIGEDTWKIKEKVSKAVDDAVTFARDLYRTAQGWEPSENKALQKAEDNAKVATPDDISMSIGDRIESKAEVVYDGHIGELMRMQDGKFVIKVDGKEESVETADLLSTNKDMGALLAYAEDNAPILSDRFANELIAGIKTEKTGDIKQFLAEAYKIRVAAYLNQVKPQDLKMDKSIANMLYRASQEDAALAEKKRLAGEGLLKPGQGKVTINGIDSEDAVNYKTELKALDKRRRGQVDTLSMLYKKMGMNVEFYEDASDSVYGEYNPITRSIRINLEGTDSVGYHHMLVTAAHEMTHFLERNSPNEYNALKEYVFNQYKKQGYNVNTLVRLKINQYSDMAAQAIADAQGKGKTATVVDALTIDGAISEIVADSCDRVLSDPALISQLAQDNHNLYTKIRDYVKSFINRFTNAARGIDASSSWYGQRMQDVHELARLWGIAFKEATDYAEGQTAPSTATSSKSLAGVMADGDIAGDVFRAEEMARAGIDADTITRETGAIQGFRGKWWKVIDNSDMHVRTKMPKTSETTLGEYYDAEELYKAYPALRNVPVRTISDPQGGFVARAMPDGIELNKAKLLTATKAQIEDTLQHEIQHVIQKIEGSNSGANTGVWSRVRSALRDSQKNAYRDDLDLLIDEYDGADNALQKYTDLYMQYGENIPASEMADIEDDLYAATQNMTDEDLSKFGRLLEKAAAVEDVRRKTTAVERGYSGYDMTAGDLYERTVGEIEARAASRRGAEQNTSIDYFGAVALEDFYDKKTGGYAFDPNYGRIQFSAAEVKADPTLKDIRKTLADPETRDFISKAALFRASLLRIERKSILQKYGLGNRDTLSFAEQIEGKKINKRDRDKLEYIANTIEKMENYSIEAMGLDEKDLGAQYVKAWREHDYARMDEILLEKMDMVEGLIPYRAPYWYDNYYIREITKDIKKNNMRAIEWAADEMAKLVPKNAVLIPMPPHEGIVKEDTDTLLLAQAISKRTKRPVLIALEGKNRMSRKEAKELGVKLKAEDLGMKQVAEIPEGMVPIFIDNTIASGETAKAAHDAIGRGITLALTKSSRSAIRGVKKAEHTYEMGNHGFAHVIPLNQRFDLDAEGVKGVRYSVAERDEAYMEAAKAGDMETAQLLVDQAAEKAFSKSKMRDKDGKLRHFYHGTNSDTFYEFDPKLIGTVREGDVGFFGRGFYFAYSEGEASYYGKKIMNVYLDIRKPFNFEKELNTLNGIKTFDYSARRAIFVTNWVQKFPELSDFEKISASKRGEENISPLSMKQFADEFMEIFNNKKFKVEKVEDKYNGDYWIATADPIEHSYEGSDGKTYKYIDYGFQRRYSTEEDAMNQASNAFGYLHDVMYDYISIPSQETIVMSSDLRGSLEKKGYDGVIQSEEGDEAVAFNSSQIKIADPITYDDNGKIIPPSERFNEEKKDIRYSLADKNRQEPYTDEEAVIKDLEASTDNEETHYGDHKQFSVRVKDPELLKFLENQEHITTYKTMQEIDGKLYPPMAAVVAGAKEDYSEFGSWEQATEHPELIKKGNNFTLSKGKGKGSLSARYNPYMHSSNLVLNDQFSSAYDRPNLVTVECIVPVSELNSGYHAEYAKDKVGWHPWHAGVVAGQVKNKKGIKRQVFLSRWIKPIRKMEDSEVADKYAELLEGTDIEIPDNVVYPSLLKALEEKGVKIKNSGLVPGRPATQKSVADRSSQMAMADTRPNALTWIRNLDVNDGTLSTREGSLVTKFKARLAVMDDTRVKIADMQEQLKTAQGDEARKLRINLQTERQKLNRLQAQINDLMEDNTYKTLTRRYQRMIDNVISGKTQEEVDARVDEMKRQITELRGIARDAAAKAEELSKDRGNDIIRNYFPATTLTKVARDIKKHFMTSMTTEEIESEIASLTLRMANGDANVGELAKDLAKRMMENIKAEPELDWDVVEKLRGRTFHLSKEQWNEMKYMGYTPKAVRSLLAGTGIKFASSESGTLDKDWNELCDEFPELTRDSSAQDEGIQLLELITNAKGFDAGQAEITEEMLGEATFELIGKMATIMPPVIEDARVKKIISNLETYVTTMGKDAASMESKIAELTQRLQALEGQSRDVSRATGNLKDQINTAIQYYETRAKGQQAEHTADELEELRKNLESKAAKRLIAEQQKWRSAIERSRKTQELAKEKTKLRGQISRVYGRVMKRLVDETDQQNIPERMKPLARAMVRSILENEAYGDKRITEFDWQQIKRQKEAFDYWDGKEGTDVDLSYIQDEEAQDTIEEALEQIKAGINIYKAMGRGYSVPNLEEDIDGLKEMQKGLITIYEFIRTQTTIDLDGRRVETAALANEVETAARENKPHKELVGRFGKPAKTLSRNVYWGNTTPEYFFRRLKNSGLSRIWDTAFHGGENRSGLLTQKFKERFAEIAERYGYSNWDRERKIELTLESGKKVSLTPEQAMSLYATYMREKTLGLDVSYHLKNGGFVLEQDEGKMLLGREEQNLIAKKFRDADFAKLDSAMTPEEKGYANAIVSLLSTEGSELGNEASMRMYGIKKYNETYYFPFQVWEGVKTKDSSAGSKINPTNNNRAAHRGFTKRRVRNAGNTVLIRPLTEVAVEHMNQMITYNTMGAAIESLNKILNYRTLEIPEDTRNLEDASTRSIESVLTERYGENAVDYIRTLLQDMNGGVTQDKRGSAVEKLLTIFKKNAVSGSMSVTLQQPLSYIRAAVMISPKYLAEAMNPATYKGSYQEMLKHSGLAVIKAMGRFDMNFGQSAKEYMMPEAAKSKAEAAYEKVTDTVNAIPGLMDSMTWTRIWTACKLETAEKNPGMDTKSEDFLKKVADRFNDVIRLTQVYDSTLVKSSMMRSRNWTARTITAFRAEPTLTANMLMDAWEHRKTKGGKKMMGAALGTYFLSAILQSAIKALLGAGRTPDEKKTFAENFAYKFAYNFVGEANPLNLIPGYDNLVDALSGNDINDNAYGVLKQIYNMLTTTRDWIGNGSENIYRSIEDTAAQLAQIVTDIPLKNLMRDGRAIYNWFLGDYADRQKGDIPGRKTSGAVLKYQTIDTVMKNDLIGAVNGFLDTAGYKTDNKSYYKRIWDAEKTGDKPRAEEMKEYLMLGKGVTENTLKSGITQAMKADQETTSADKAEYLIETGTDDTTYINGEYKDGKLTAEEYGNLYKQIHPDKTADDLYWQLDKLDYEKETGTTDGYSKYNGLYAAVETNKAAEITASVKEMMDHGTKASSIQTQITKQYKEEYLQLKAGSAEKVKLKDAIIKALKATGMSAEQAKKKIDSWK